MISFSCKCGKKYEVPEKYAGKKVRCKKCDNMIRVPSLEKDDSAVMMTEIIEPESERNSTQKHNTKQSVITSVSENSGLPKPLIYTFISIGILFIGFISYFLVFRDTWERDNLMKMSQMISEASQQYNLENGAGLKTYEELCVLIGDRDLKNERLRLEYNDVQEKYEKIKDEIKAEKKRQAALARQEMEKRREEEKARQKKLAEAEKQKELKEEREQQEMLNRIGFIKSLGKYNEAIIDLKNGIQMGVNVREFSRKTNVLMNAFSKIKITPGIQAYISFKEFEEMKVAENLSPEETDKIKSKYIELATKVSEIGDEDAYVLYMSAKNTKDFAILVVKNWSSMVESASSPYFYEFKANRDRNVEHLTNNLTMYEEAYSKIK